MELDISNLSPPKNAFLVGLPASIAIRQDIVWNAQIHMLPARQVYASVRKANKQSKRTNAKMDIIHLLSPECAPNARTTAPNAMVSTSVMSVKMASN